MPIISVASPENAATGVTVTAVKAPQSNRVSLRFRVKLSNKSNRILLCKLRMADEKAFGFRPTNSGILSPYDTEPFEVTVVPDAKLEAITDIGLSVEAAYVETTAIKKQSIVDAVATWKTVRKEKIATLRIPIKFNVLSEGDASAIEPTMVVLEVTDESAPRRSPMELVSQANSFRRNYPEESWAAGVLAIAVVIVLFVIGVYLGSRLASR